MIGRVHVLCRPALTHGFLLAGLEAEAVADPEDGLQRLIELAADPQVGLILVEDDIHEKLTDEARRRIFRRTHPLVVPFPSPREGVQTNAEDQVVEILRQAIGYRVRLR